jgi:carbamate kinase
VQAACRFAASTGKAAAIGALPDLARVIEGIAGTTIVPGSGDIVYA